MNPMPGQGGGPVLAEVPLRLNPVPAPPPGYPPAGFPNGYPQQGGFAQQAYQPAPQAYTPPPPPPPPPAFVPQLTAPGVPAQASLAQAAPSAPQVQAPQIVAPVAPVAASQATPPPPPPPPPPKMSPYFRRGSSRFARQYTYRPPPTQHPVLQIAARVAYPPNTMVAPSVDLRGLLPAVRDAGSGLTNGFAVAALRELLHAAATGAMLPTPSYLSPAYLSTRARLTSGGPVEPGTSLADEFATILQYGICPEDYYPFVVPTDQQGSDSEPSDVMPATLPSAACDVAALPFRLGGLQQVDWSSTVNAKVLLGNKQGIVVGFIAYESWEDVGSDGKVRMFSAGERVLGGMTALIVGYSDYGWILRCPYGTDFGDKGYVHVPFGYEQVFLEAYSAQAQP